MHLLTRTNIIIGLIALVTLGPIPFNVTSNFWGNIKPAVDELFLLGLFGFVGYDYYSQKAVDRFLPLEVVLIAFTVNQLFNLSYGIHKTVLNFAFPLFDECQMQPMYDAIFYPHFALHYFVGLSVILAIGIRYAIWYSLERNKQ